MAKKQNLLNEEEADLSQFLGGDTQRNEVIHLVEGEDDQFIEDAMDEFIESEEDKEDILKRNATMQRLEKRSLIESVRRAAGVKKPKNSRFPTRSNDFLNDPISDRGIYLILNQHRTDIYKEGVDQCPRVMLGIPAYNNPCTKNAFEHLQNFQDKLKVIRKDNPAGQPKWIIISTDSAMISDRNILSRLDTLRPTTHIAGPYGFQSCPRSGTWFDPAPGTPESEFRGCYMQGNMDNLNWHFNVGAGFKDHDRYKVALIHGPFIAIRGTTFMQLDFKRLSLKMKGGFYHFMADISMQIYEKSVQCGKKDFFAAQISSPCMQFDNIRNHMNNADFAFDQALFVSRWQKVLPASL